MQLPAIPLTGDKAFQSIARDKWLKMQITREKECVQSMLCLLRWSVQKREEAQSPRRDTVEENNALKKEARMHRMPLGPDYLGPLL